MTKDEIVVARADIEATADLLERGRIFPMSATEPIVLSWEEWKASRAAKRAALAVHGLDKPSRRTTAIGSQEKRLRKAFDDKRAPNIR